MDVKDLYTRTFLKASGEEATLERIKKLRADWWWNVRSKEEGGLRLTEYAIKYIEQRAEIKTYKIDLPKGLTISPQILVWLDNFIDSPYYLTKKNITVLKEKAAFELYLFAGDVKKLGYTKAMAKRIDHN